jgi:hypothetical protein
MHSRITLLATCLIALTLALASLMLPSPAAAQDQPITLDTLTIDLWPEFDQPSMLVIYGGSVAEAAGPVELTFSLPRDAEFHVAAYIDEMDRLIEIPEREVGENSVTFVSPNGTFRIEFYDPTLDTSRQERQYIYTYPGDYAVSTLNWSVQVPPTAESMTTEPAGALTTGLFDIAYYVAAVTDISQNEPTGILVKYTKHDAALTTDARAQQPEPALEEESNNTAIIALLVVIALAVLGIGAYVVIQTRRMAVAASTPVYRSARRGGKSGRRSKAVAEHGAPVERGAPLMRRTAASTPASLRFCTECGTEAANTDDKYCRKCGAALRQA